MPALLSERENFDFRALAQRMNRYSRWALSAGVAKGETIGLEKIVKGNEVNVKYKKTVEGVYEAVSVKVTK